jgi:hypothetical protein
MAGLLGWQHQVGRYQRPFFIRNFRHLKRTRRERLGGLRSADILLWSFDVA